jgi:hypothetical protein
MKAGMAHGLFLWSVHVFFLIFLMNYRKKKEEEYVYVCDLQSLKYLVVGAFRKS